MTAPNVGPGNIPNVPGAQPVSELGFAAHAGRDEPAWREQIDGQWKDKANGSGIGSVFTSITNLFSNVGSLFDSIGALFDRADAIEDGQLELNDRTDLLSPLLDYGSSYANTSNSITNIGQFSYGNQIGPMTGCHLSGGRIVFDDKGLWDIRARIYIAFTVSPFGHDVAWEVRVLRPDGSIFSTTEDVYTGPQSQTREINTSVVVPAAGYQAQVYVKTLLVGRAIDGGPHRSRLTVQHISRSTTNPI